ncbi:hypothetical protein LX36DRAFT_471851 [Colletotrichum falcatum]|nr:hypothetical protein LX36DRAFT_471851 [Colletotrichum falcatum]
MTCIASQTLSLICSTGGPGGFLVEPRRYLFRNLCGWRLDFILNFFPFLLCVCTGGLSGCESHRGQHHATCMG